MHIDFWVPLFPPCWTEWSGLRSLVAMFRCVKVCSKAILSPSYQIGFPLNSHGEAFLKCQAIEKIACVFCSLLYALPGLCGLPLSLLRSSSWLAGTKNSFDFQRQRFPEREITAEIVIFDSTLSFISCFR